MKPRRLNFDQFENSEEESDNFPHEDNQANANANKTQLKIKLVKVVRYFRRENLINEIMTQAAQKPDRSGMSKKGKVSTHET